MKRMSEMKKKRVEDKYRQISFFELSGEVFKYFYEITNNSTVLKEEDRKNVENSFRTLNLLLNSKNQKIYIWKAKPFNIKLYGTPGQVCIIDNRAIVTCSGGGIILEEIQIDKRIINKPY